MLRRVSLATGAILLGLLFVAGLARIIRLRFDRGDVYPPYSSLRADPLGTKVLHDALAGFGPVAVTRRLRESPGGDDFRGATLLRIGVSEGRAFLSGEGLRELGARAARGTRVVVALYPAPAREEKKEEKEKTAQSKKKTGDANKVEEEKKPEAAFEYGTFDHMKDLWATSRDGTMGAIPWRAARYFSKIPEGWRVVFAVGEKPVVVERAYGDGSIAAIGDSYLFSNEALYGERYLEFLLWAVGGKREVVFDETAHGIRQSDNVMVLIRRYRLTPLLGVVALLGALYLLRNGSPLAFRREPAATGVVVGRAAGSGLLHLLRRSIAPPDLIAACVERWELDAAALARGNEALAAQVRAACEADRARPPRERQPAATYRAIARMLARQKGNL
jgi:hypothetical protein